VGSFFSCLLTLSLFLFVNVAVVAKEQAKGYPQEGKVVGTGVSGQTVQSGDPPAAVTKYTHVYTIETVTEIFKLDCGKQPFGPWSSTGGECGGDKKIQIGDVLHFRVHKGWAYISVTSHNQPGEQKMRILSEDRKPESRAAGNPDAAK